MKASELIRELQKDVESFGDREVVMACDDLENEIDLGAVGYLTTEKGERKYVLHCAECHDQFVADEIAASEGHL